MNAYSTKWIIYRALELNGYVIHIRTENQAFIVDYLEKGKGKGAGHLFRALWTLKKS
jgi:hypothetical protein